METRQGLMVQSENGCSQTEKRGWEIWLKKMSAEAHTCVFSMLASGARLLQVLGQPTKTLTQRAKKDLWAGKEVGIPYSQGHRVIVAGKAFVLMEQDREHAPKDTS